MPDGTEGSSPSRDDWGATWEHHKLSSTTGGPTTTGDAGAIDKTTNFQSVATHNSEVELVNSHISKLHSVAFKARALLTKVLRREEDKAVARLRCASSKRAICLVRLADFS